MYRKLLSSIFICLLLSYNLFIPAGYATVEKNDNLKEFLKSQKEVFVRYEYPSMKLANSKVQNSSNSVVLPAGTPIILRNRELIDSGIITTGSSVAFTVVNDVVVDNTVVIKAGSIVDAQISYAKRRNYAGVAGEIIVSDFAVRAIDGTYVPLRATLSSKGEEKIALSAGLGILICVLFLLIKGEDAVIPAGTTKCVYTMMDMKINTLSN